LKKKLSCGIIFSFCGRKLNPRKNKIFYYTHIGTDHPGVAALAMEVYDPDVVEKPEREDI